MSTLALGEELKAAGMTFVDAPLSRTPVEAEAGTLDTMVGCASVSMRDGGHVAASLWEQLRHTHLAPIEHQVRPRLPLPVEELQRDLPVESRPFDTWAAEAGVSADELLEQCRTFVDRAYMRRFAAVLNHRKAGFGANGMAVWKVPEEELDELGPRMAAFSAVSHCYKRPTYPDWPYSIFTMVHARSKEACEEAIAAIAEDTGITDPDRRAVLYSTYEFKKIRLMYYTPDYREWEDLAQAGAPLPRWRRR